MNVNNAISWFPKVLRSIGCKYGKPYMHNYQKHENAENNS